jgi:hypothetical protein
MKTVYIMTVAAALACGCGPKAKPAQTPIPASVSSAPAPSNAAPVVTTLQPGRTTLPITGAFGWTLGNKIPVRLQHRRPDVTPGTFFADAANTNTPPFVNIGVDGLNDGTIYQIHAEVAGMQGDVVKAALEAKYGPETIGKDGEGLFELWTNGDAEIRFRSGFELEYRSISLARKSFLEYKADLHQSGAALAPKL